MDIIKKTKQQLYELAKQFKLPNRSKMNKTMLIQALMPILSTSTKLPTMSSTALTKRPAVQAPLPPDQKPNPYPIPKSYDRDFITLMPVDPSHTYACWELTSKTKNKYQKKGNNTPTHILLKLCIDKKGRTFFLESLRVGQIGSYFFHHYIPNTECWVEMDISDETGKYSRIMSSKRIIVPDDQIHETGEFKSMKVKKNTQGFLVLSKQNPMEIHGKKLDTKWKYLSSTELSRRPK